MPELNWTQIRRLEQYFFESTREHPSYPIVISDGDSWFAYPAYPNIIDDLDDIVARRMSLLRLEGSGDELLGILGVGGLARLKTLMKHYKPDVLLFSAGGNDIVGPELLTFVEERGSTFDVTKALGNAALAQRFADMKAAYQRLIAARDEVAPRCLIVTHGYGRAIPSGKKGHFLGLSFGPWMKPFLEEREYTDPIEQRAVIDALLLRFNALIDSFAGPLFTKADFRSVISDDEWDNEIHPNRHGFQDCANVLHDTLKRLLPAKFPK